MRSLDTIRNVKNREPPEHLQFARVYALTCTHLTYIGPSGSHIFCDTSSPLCDRHAPTRYNVPQLAVADQWPSVNITAIIQDILYILCRSDSHCETKRKPPLKLKDLHLFTACETCRPRMRVTQTGTILSK